MLLVLYFHNQIWVGSWFTVLSSCSWANSTRVCPESGRVTARTFRHHQLLRTTGWHINWIQPIDHHQSDSSVCSSDQLKIHPDDPNNFQEFDWIRNYVVTWAFSQSIVDALLDQADLPTPVLKTTWGYMGKGTDSVWETQHMSMYVHSCFLDVCVWNPWRGWPGVKVQGMHPQSTRIPTSLACPVLWWTPKKVTRKNVFLGSHLLPKTTTKKRIIYIYIYI